MNRLTVVLCGLVLAALLTTSAWADTVYTYTGNPFNLGNEPDNTVAPPFTTSDSVSGWFTVATPFGLNMALAQVNSISYSFTDGLNTITTGKATTFFDFEIGTDATGAINVWDVDLGDAAFNYVGTDFGPASGGNLDLGIWVDNPFASVGENEEDPGTWTVSSTDPTPAATPEPSSIALLGTGALGLAGMLRRRFLAYRIK